MFQCLTFPATILDAKRNSSKMEVGISLEEWLEDDENLKLWEDGKLTKSDKRVLITKFVGSAWEKIFSRSDFSADIYFQRTGCLLTCDGSDDHLVNIEGLKDYKPPFVRLNDAKTLKKSQNQQRSQLQMSNLKMTCSWKWKKWLLVLSVTLTM